MPLRTRDIAQREGLATRNAIHRQLINPAPCIAPHKEAQLLDKLVFASDKLVDIHGKGNGRGLPGCFCVAIWGAALSEERGGVKLRTHRFYFIALATVTVDTEADVGISQFHTTEVRALQRFSIR